MIKGRSSCCVFPGIRRPSGRSVEILDEDLWHKETPRASENARAVICTESLSYCWVQVSGGWGNSNHNKFLYMTPNLPHPMLYFLVNITFCHSLPVKQNSSRTTVPVPGKHGISDPSGLAREENEWMTNNSAAADKIRVNIKHFRFFSWNHSVWHLSSWNLPQFSLSYWIISDTLEVIIWPNGTVGCKRNQVLAWVYKKDNLI